MARSAVAMTARVSSTTIVKSTYSEYSEILGTASGLNQKSASRGLCAATL
jgi:hypothetical protein